MENAFLAFDVAGATKTYKDEIEELKAENEQLAKALGKATVRADFAEGKLKSLDLSNKKALIDLFISIIDSSNIVSPFFSNNINNFILIKS